MAKTAVLQLLQPDFTWNWFYVTSDWQTNNEISSTVEIKVRHFENWIIEFGDTDFLEIKCNNCCFQIEKEFIYRIFSPISHILIIFLMNYNSKGRIWVDNWMYLRQHSTKERKKIHAQKWRKGKEKLGCLIFLRISFYMGNCQKLSMRFENTLIGTKEVQKYCETKSHNSIHI